MLSIVQAEAVRLATFLWTTGGNGEARHLVLISNITGNELENYMGPFDYSYSTLGPPNASLFCAI